MTPAEAAIRAEIARRGPIPFADFMALALGHPEGGYYTAAAARPTRGGRLPDGARAAPGLRGCARPPGRRGLGATRPARPVHARRVRRGGGNAGPGDPRRPPRRRLAAGGCPRATPRSSSTDTDWPSFARAPRRPACPSSTRPGSTTRPAAGRRPRQRVPRRAPGPPRGGARRAAARGPRGDRLRRSLRGRARRAVRRRAGDATGALGAAGIALVEGQRLEVRPAVEAWAREVGRRLAAGLVLVLDYGAPAADLYGPRRRAGTLMTYRGHVAESDPGRPTATSASATSPPTSTRPPSAPRSRLPGSISWARRPRRSCSSAAGSRSWSSGARRRSPRRPRRSSCAAR